MNRILFDEGEIQVPLIMSDERARHIVHVLHKKEGDSFEAGIVNGASGTAHIRALSKEALCFSFVAEHMPEPLYPIKLIIGFPRPIQLKRLLRDAASLGVCHIHLTGTELGEKSYMQSTLVERGAAERCLRDGAVQAKSTCVPALSLHASLVDCLAEIQVADDASSRLVFDLVEPRTPLVSLPFPAKSSFVYAAIGSERGWTSHERSLLASAAFVSHSLGERILRTETATTAAITLLLVRMGLL